MEDSKSNFRVELKSIAFDTCQVVWYQSRYSNSDRNHTSNYCTYRLLGIPYHQLLDMENRHLRISLTMDDCAIKCNIIHEGATLSISETFPLDESIFSGFVSMADPKAFISKSNSTGTPSGVSSMKFS